MTESRRRRLPPRHWLAMLLALVVVCVLAAVALTLTVLGRAGSAGIPAPGDVLSTIVRARFGLSLPNVDDDFSCGRGTSRGLQLRQHLFGVTGPPRHADRAELLECGIKQPYGPFSITRNPTARVHARFVEIHPGA